MKALKGIFYAGLAVVIVVAFFFLSSFVGMIASAFWLASWMIAWAIRNFVVTIIVVIAVYVLYKWFRSR